LKDPNISWNERLKYNETIEKTGKNLLRIINDILDVSKVESGHLDIEKTSFSLPDFLNELLMMMRVKAENVGNDLNFIKQGEVQEKIHTDRIRLRQVLVNLINNALKFTEHGSVTMTYSQQGNKIIFQISDTGRGISTEQQERIFVNFAQVDENKKTEGTGLGLGISKRLAQALGGDVILKESVLGKGSVFEAFIYLDNGQEAVVAAQPVKKPADNVKKLSLEIDENILQGKKVLVVEDVIDNQMLTKLYLARKGMKVQFANNGAEGVQKALEDSFDLILMDMQMPVMDGYTATKQLREKGFRKPIIALTAHAMKEDREKCLQAGCDDYLTKPLDSNVLYQAISKNLSAFI
jgi:CheY-like chemotaxis protein